MAAYLGTARPLSTLLFEPPHSLSEQAFRPREQIHGHINVDGTAVAWWPGATSTAPVPESPLRYATAGPPWADENLEHLAARLTGVAQIAAVRSATPGMGFGAAFAAPFVVSGLAFAHNGWISGFQGSVGRALLASLDDQQYGDLVGLTDSVLLFAALRRHIGAGLDLASAVVATLEQARQLCREHHETGTFNFLACDGAQVVATRASSGAAHNSLYVSEAAFEGATVVASEPLNDASWKTVPEEHLLIVDSTGIDMRPLSP